MSSFLFEKPSNSNFKGSRRKKNRLSNTKVAPNQESSTERKLKASFKNGDNWVEFVIPIITVSEANGGVKRAYKRNGKTCYKGEHWTDKHRRHKIQKGSVALILNPHREHLSLPCNITLTRYAPDKLDRFDNLPMSLKWVLDAVCEIITGDYRPGRADENDGILDVTYKQELSDVYGVKIRVESAVNID